MVLGGPIIPLLAAGLGLFLLVNAITRPAQASQSAGAITETVGTLGAAGEGIKGFGEGIGSGLAGLFKPVWEVANLFERFSNLSGGAANVSPVAQGGFKPSAPTWTVSQGGSSISTTPSSSPFSSGGVSSYAGSTGGFRAAN